MNKNQLHINIGFIEHLDKLVEIFDNETPDYVKHSYEDVVEQLIIKECMTQKVIS